MAEPAKDRIMVPVIIVISVLIPLVVAFLLFIPSPEFSQGMSVKFLPKLNAVINFSVTILLVAGFIFIRQRKIHLHRIMMMTAAVLSAAFLISYVVYHYLSEETKYAGEGFLRYLYFFILASHILLSVVIVPLVLFSIYRGLNGQYEKHRKMVRWTFPLWLYVAVTGVLVYLFVHVLNPTLP